ncbi:darcynin family protein [Microbulbifer rhizosphaerae]|uniref:Darcynin 2 n=1 Tax=Microbulbifer rhizosphaerae TaxID=1562603 RepID=A0A7W4WCX5_9GAMM|nr:darcynin family protein [Microbulbifer rhizosphaerae]MBB3061938.1 hypothetical protein [Microbulbifer rhizosphaerae]
MQYTIIVTYRFSNLWLQLSREARRDFQGTHVLPLFEKYADSVRVRFFDAEAFATHYTDFAIFETEDLKHYYFLIEELRDSPLLAQGYAEFKDILIGIEDGYQDFDRETSGMEDQT